MSRLWRALMLVAAAMLMLGSAVGGPPNYTEAAKLIKAGKADELKRALSGSKPEESSTAGRTLLMSTAVTGRSAQALSALLDWGIDPNQAMQLTHQGETLRTTPLLFAIFGRGGVPIVTTLLQRGADPNLRAELSLPLATAIELRQYPVANSLLDHGADAKAADGAGATALMQLVISAEDAEPVAAALAQRLLDAGADVNARGPLGSTALRWAVLGGKPSLVKMLLAARADPNTVNDKGESVLQLAQRKQLADIASQLQAAGARP